jgi:hypothetical protein
VFGHPIFKGKFVLYMEMEYELNFLKKDIGRILSSRKEELMHYLVRFTLMTFEDLEEFVREICPIITSAWTRMLFERLQADKSEERIEKKRLVEWLSSVLDQHNKEKSTVAVPVEA